MTMVATYTTINTHVRILFPFPILFIIAPSECLDSHSMVFFSFRSFYRSSFSFSFSFSVCFLFFFFDIVRLWFMRFEYISNSQLHWAYWTSIYISINNQTIQIDCSCCCFWNLLSTIFCSRFPLILIVISRCSSYFEFGQPGKIFIERCILFSVNIKTLYTFENWLITIDWQFFLFYIDRQKAYNQVVYAQCG